MTTVPAGKVARPRRLVGERRARALSEKVALHRTTPEAAGSVIFSALAAISAVWVLYERILPFEGELGFWLLCYVAFIAFYGAVTALQFGRQVTTNRLCAAGVTTGAILVVVVLVDLIAYTAFKGASVLGHSNFFTETMSNAGPLSGLDKGGALHAAVGSLEQLAIATAISVPLGMLAALYMAEVGGTLSRVVRTLVDAMTALPSIVAGLFVLSLYIVTLKFPQGGFAAALAMSVMMMPIITRASEVIIRLVPDSLREAGYALGSSHWRVVWSVVLPTARSGLTTAVVLGMARGIGETSPVLLTAGFTKELNVNPLSGQQANLPVYIYNYIKFPQPSYVARAFGAGVTLLIVVFVLFVIARMLGGVAPGEISRRQRRRMTKAARAAEQQRAASSAESAFAVSNSVPMSPPAS